METLMPGLVGSPTLHPLLVHFPIALWLTAFLLSALGSLRRLEAVYQAGTWLLYLGTAASLLAVVTGWLAAEQLGHDSPGHDLVHVHRNLMVGATGLAVLASATAAWAERRSSSRARWLVTGLLLAVSALTTLGADRGALLVYGFGMGVSEDAAEPAGHDHGHDHGH